MDTEMNENIFFISRNLHFFPINSFIMNNATGKNLIIECL